MRMLGIALALALLLVPVGVEAAPPVVVGQDLHFEMPDATEIGMQIDGYTQRAGTIKMLQGVGKDELRAIEASAKSAAAHGALQAWGIDDGVIAQMRSAISQSVPATDLYGEAWNDMFQMLCNVGEGYKRDSRNLIGITDFVGDAVKTALTNGDTKYFMDENVRREFWRSTGLYDKYTDQDIAYINQVVMPSLAAEMVLHDWNGLFHLWQALNGIAADVSSVIGNSTIMNDLTGSVMFDGREFAAYKDVMNAFNGSTGALGLLYFAADQFGTNTGSYANTDEALAGYEIVWSIPQPEHEPAARFNNDDTPHTETEYSYQFHIKLTK